MLLYHRVADELSDPYGLCVSPDRFDEHVEIVRELGRPMRLTNFVEALRTRTLPDRAIAITFDDGYVDNIQAAEPILARHEVPALVFVTTGAGGREREFWWDELERALLQPGEVPDRLEIQIGDDVHRWQLGDATSYRREHQELHRQWHLLDETAPTTRHEVFRQLYSLIQPLPGAERTIALDQVLSWAGCDPTVVRPARQAMRPDQVADMVSRGILDVGAHTVNHPALPTQPPEVQRTELEQSKRDLEAWCGRPVHGFAYPYGLYDRTAVAAARAAGFTFACSGAYRAARPGTDAFLIPRIEAPAEDGDALGDLLRWQLR